MGINDLYPCILYCCVYLRVAEEVVIIIWLSVLHRMLGDSVTVHKVK